MFLMTGEVSKYRTVKVLLVLSFPEYFSRFLQEIHG